MKHVIFLIISSNTDPIYSFMKDCFRFYAEPFRKHNPFCHFSYFFVEYKNEIEESLMVTNDTIYIKGVETVIPGIFIKTCKAIDYINQQFSYNYMVRTNLSSFWNIPVFLEYLSTQKIQATGLMMFSSFLSGTSIVISKEVATEFIQCVNRNKEISGSILLENHDDVLISHFLKMVVPITSFPENRVCFLLDKVNTTLPEDISNIFYFRIKSGERLQDVLFFIQLMKKIYNKAIDTNPLL